MYFCFIGLWFYFKFSLIITAACVYVWAHATEHVWRSENDFSELVFFSTVGSEDQTLVVSLAWQVHLSTESSSWPYLFYFICIKYAVPRREDGPMSPQS